MRIAHVTMYLKVDGDTFECVLLLTCDIYKCAQEFAVSDVLSSAVSDVLSSTNVVDFCEENKIFLYTNLI